MSKVSKSYYEGGCDPVISYTAKHTIIQTPLQLELQKSTLENAPMSQMLGAPEVLTFGQNFIRAFGGRKVADIGTFTGASALAWALALPENGQVYTFDIDHTNFKKFGVPIISKCSETFKKIIPVEGPAIDNLDKLISEGHAETFDFVFIDADKANYSNYYDRAMILLRKGGVVFIDNSLWSGKVVDIVKNNDDSTIAINSLNDKVFNDDRSYSALINLGDGTHIAFKK